MKKKKQREIHFIDLFAGLGGFHIALTELGCKCVFASELKEDLQALYKRNYPETKYVVGDITKVDLTTIPCHDILCAGFPCQPFSQAGKREGFQDPAGRGNLFDYICAVIRAQGENKPSILLLENVSNLRGHDNGKTWTIIQEKLDDLGYYVKDEILSPHQYGYPQHRKRIYIVGVRKDIADAQILDGFEFLKEDRSKLCDIRTVVDEADENIQPLSLKTHQQLKVWQEFINQTLLHKDNIPTFPIWAMEYGADYPYEEKAPAFLTKKDLVKTHGKLGWEINGPSLDDCIHQLPIYAQTDTKEKFPAWKIKYIKQNREFYIRNQVWLNTWMDNIKDWDNSHQKFEWNCGGDGNGLIKDKIIQFRASGIRVKNPTYSPALNLVGTQVPILPWIKLPVNCVPSYTDEELAAYGLTQDDIKYGRYLSIREAAALQGMESISFEGLSNTRIYEALGNAVNTQVVKKIASQLINVYLYANN